MRFSKFFMVFLVASLANSLFAQPKVIAHRGFWKTEGSAQNSIRSLVKADSIKVYASEFDVWMTSDNKLVVNHDRVFKGYTMDSTKFSVATSIKLDNGENLPTLESYLTQVQKQPNTRIVLEMKSLVTPKRETAEVKKIVKMIKKYKLADRTDYIAFSKHATKEFVRLSPKSAVYYLNGEATPEELKAWGCAGLDYSFKVLKKHPEWIEQAHKLGLKVNVWTVDKEEDMRFFIGKNVDFITTNEPLLLQSILAQ